MKKLNILGKIISIIGVLHLFRKVNGLNGFGGYIDNSLEILIISFALIIVGVIMFYYRKDSLKTLLEAKNS